MKLVFDKFSDSLRRDRNGGPMVSTTFGGRNIDILVSNHLQKDIHLVDGRALCLDDLDDETQSKLTFKQLRDLKQKHHAQNDKNWNTFFVQSDSILR